MVEHELINAFMKLMSKAGGGSLVKDMIQHSDETGNPKIWTRTEVESALVNLNQQIENFGKQEAIEIVETLLRKYRLHPEDFKAKYDEEIPEATGVKGLQ
jgi:hypothetical protein